MLRSVVAAVRTPPSAGPARTSVVQFPSHIWTLPHAQPTEQERHSGMRRVLVSGTPAGQYEAQQLLYTLQHARGGPLIGEAVHSVAVAVDNTVMAHVVGKQGHRVKEIALVSGSVLQVGLLTFPTPKGFRHPLPAPPC